MHGLGFGLLYSAPQNKCISSAQKPDSSAQFLGSRRIKPIRVKRPRANTLGGFIYIRKRGSTREGIQNFTNTLGG